MQRITAESIDHFTEVGEEYAYQDEADPRLVAVITRDPEPDWPEQDGVASATLGNKYLSQDDYLGSLIQEAWSHSHDHEFVCRYLRAFHDYEAVDYTDYGFNGEATLYVAIESGSGFTDPASAVKGAMSEWQAYDHGEVYAVGVLINLDQTLPTGDLPTEEGDGWEWEDVLVHGFYGLDIAAEAALEDLSVAQEHLSRTYPML